MCVLLKPFMGVGVDGRMWNCGMEGDRAVEVAAGLLVPSRDPHCLSSSASHREKAGYWRNLGV